MKGGSITIKKSIVVTSIASPNEAMRMLARGCQKYGYKFYVIGDVPSPKDFQLDGCTFLDIKRQLMTGFKYASICPTRHYARKNIGYLLAMQQKSEIIVETDDDNLPYESFWAYRQPEQDVNVALNYRWLNVYRYFSDANIWPRGFALNWLKTNIPDRSELPTKKILAPIQQGLADKNPDVDAIYRLVLPLPLDFQKGTSVALGRGTWCPFNSQNTTWFPQAFPILYLPATCSFRMTDIWRGFVAQRIAWENEWFILFHQATVWQRRNEHNLMKDFSDEMDGYLMNEKICDALFKLKLKPGTDYLLENLRICYETLVQHDFIGREELPLVEAWSQDVNALPHN